MKRRCKSSLVRAAEEIGGGVEPRGSWWCRDGPGASPPSLPQPGEAPLAGHFSLQTGFVPVQRCSVLGTAVSWGSRVGTFTAVKLGDLGMEPFRNTVQREGSYHNISILCWARRRRFSHQGAKTEEVPAVLLELSLGLFVPFFLSSFFYTLVVLLIYVPAKTLP